MQLDKCGGSDSPTYEAGYAKALDDYAVVDLLRKLNDFDAIDEGGRSIAPSWEEASVLAALLIGELSDRIDSMLMSSYFLAMRQGQTDAFPVPTLQYPQSTELPVGFDNGSDTATRAIFFGGGGAGDKVRWRRCLIHPNLSSINSRWCC